MYYGPRRVVERAQQALTVAPESHERVDHKAQPAFSGGRIRCIEALNETDGRR